jgi:hypothetical protein
LLRIALRAVKPHISLLPILGCRWERRPYFTIQREIGLPVLSPAHISGDGIARII